MGLEDNRREYDYGNLTRESLLDDPFSQFDLWINQAIESQIQDPTAMSLSTVNAEGKPWQRMVLLKHFDTSGFVFYTNTASRKASEIDNNPHVSLHFPWLQLDRQVIVGGKAERLSTTEVVKYFLVALKEVSLQPGLQNKVVLLVRDRFWSNNLIKSNKNLPMARCHCQIFGVVIE